MQQGKESVIQVKIMWETFKEEEEAASESESERQGRAQNKENVKTLPMEKTVGESTKV